MVIIHRVFRRELGLLPALFRQAAPGDAARSAELVAHLDLVLEVLDHHHEGEDLLLWPRLRERAPEAKSLFDDMSDDHERLHALLADARAAARRWHDSVDADAATTLAAAVEALAASLNQHLDHEEAAVLPLVDRLLTQAEWNELGARAFSLLDPDAAMIVLAQMGEESPPAEWQEFMRHLPPPVQAAYTSTALPAYGAYVSSIRDRTSA